jgi:hypothetical protein
MITGKRAWFWTCANATRGIVRVWWLLRYWLGV